MAPFWNWILRFYSNNYPIFYTPGFFSGKIANIVTHSIPADAHYFFPPTPSKEAFPGLNSETIALWFQIATSLKTSWAVDWPYMLTAKELWIKGDGYYTIIRELTPEQIRIKQWIEGFDLANYDKYYGKKKILDKPKLKTTTFKNFYGEEVRLKKPGDGDPAIVYALGIILIIFILSR